MKSVVMGNLSVIDKNLTDREEQFKNTIMRIHAMSTANSA